MPENSSFVTIVTATDPDQTTPTYSLSGGADQFLFTIDPVTGVLSFNKAPDFESPEDSDVDNSYIVEVQATDGTLSDFQTIFVEITDVTGATIMGTAAKDVIDAMTTVPGQSLPTGEEDTIYGGAGRDKIDSGLGADVMFGGPDNDLYIVDNPGDLVIEKPQEGTDWVKSSISFVLGENIENLTFTGSDDTDGIGNGSANTITGNTGNNLLSGERGKDTLRGNAGDDILIGGEDFDIYAGGSGADQFVFAEPFRASADRVTDFSSAQGDRLAVYGDDYGLATGVLPDASYFALTRSSLADVDHGRFLYKDANGTLYWDADGAVATSNTTIATFDTAVTLSELDFLVL